MRDHQLCPAFRFASGKGIMSSKKGSLKYAIAKYLNEIGLGMRAQLIIIFLLVKVIPLVLLAMIAWRQFTNQGDELRDIAVNDSAWP